MKKNIFYLLYALVLKAIFLQGCTTKHNEYTIKLEDIVLPVVNKNGGKPLMQTLNERKSIRSFTNDNLTMQQLSELLWAGWGINRQSTKERTAPSARNLQEIEIYVALADGLYLYDAEINVLKQTIV